LMEGIIAGVNRLLKSVLPLADTALHRHASSLSTSVDFAHFHTLPFNPMLEDAECRGA
jgi:hypothetical protein